MADNIAYHRKYRPATIDDYMGDKIRNILLNRFSDTASFPSTILMHGSRGCGKTSAARLIAKEYHCESRVNGHACGVCEMCKTVEDHLIATEAGEEIEGVIEIDAAKTGGKDDMTNIIQDALELPMYTKYKVLILDECHMISKAAQNSLLKVVEEPPEHLVFIFCTTNPEDVLDTIKSRCQLIVQVERPTIDVIADRLMWISQQERLTTSKEALKIIAKKSGRIPREALNMLEDIAKNYNKQVTVENIRDRTGDVATDVYMGYYKAANGTLEEILLFTKKIKEQDISYRNFVSGLVRFTLDCMYIKYGIAIEEYPKEYLAGIKEMFKMYTSSEMDLLLQIVENAARLVSSDDNKNELLITTTAMRVGKLKLLADGILAGTAEDSHRETRVGFSKYQAFLRQERLATQDKVEAEEVDVSFLAGMFGRDVTRIDTVERSSGSDTEDEGLADERHSVELESKSGTEQMGEFAEMPAEKTESETEKQEARRKEMTIEELMNRLK